MRGFTEPVLSEPAKHGELLKTMLARPNLCSRNWITRQYDHEVQGGSVIKPLVGKKRDIPSDAAVMRPILGSETGIVVSQALSPLYSEIDTYAMTAVTIDEAVRKAIAVGGDPDHLGGVDNFCWPTVQYDPVTNPDGKYKAAQLVRSCWALRDTCLAFKIPLLSGKDSMYIDGNLEGPYGERRKVSGKPALLFTVSSVVQDVKTCVTMDAKFPGDLVYVLGETRNELGGSEYYQLMDKIGLHVPKIDVSHVWPLYLALHQAIRQGLVSSAHAVSKGGLAVHLAMVAMAGELGMEVHIGKSPSRPGLSSAQLLYSESAGRFVVTVNPARRAAFEKLFASMPVACIGGVTETQRFKVQRGKGELIIDEDVSDLKKAWNSRFGGLI
jgi:phosphoribosylformylglycinamidine synthase